MATFVRGDCPNKEEHSKDKHDFDSAQIIGFNPDKWMNLLRCGHCGHEWMRIAPLKRKKSLHYPHYNDAIGGVVDSREHEEHLAKESGLEHL